MICNTRTRHETEATQKVNIDENSRLVFALRHQASPSCNPTSSSDCCGSNTWPSGAMRRKKPWPKDFCAATFRSAILSTLQAGKDKGLEKNKQDSSVPWHHDNALHSKTLGSRWYLGKLLLLSTFRSEIGSQTIPANNCKITQTHKPNLWRFSI